MFEKVNPSHPDKVADRIAGALVDLAYANQENPKVAVEVLLGHGECTIITESSFKYTDENVHPIVKRLAGDDVVLKLKAVPQDEHLAHNQDGQVRCGDNGIFKGEPLTNEEMELSEIAQKIYEVYPTDGKYIIDDKSMVGNVLRYLVVCDFVGEEGAMVGDSKVSPRPFISGFIGKSELCSFDSFGEEDFY